jgi:hypothetical protein
VAQYLNYFCHKRALHYNDKQHSKQTYRAKQNTKNRGSTNNLPSKQTNIHRRDEVGRWYLPGYCHNVGGVRAGLWLAVAAHGASPLVGLSSHCGWSTVEQTTCKTNMEHSSEMVLGNPQWRELPKMANSYRRSRYATITQFFFIISQHGNVKWRPRRNQRPLASDQWQPKADEQLCKLHKIQVFTAVTKKNAVFWEIKTQFVPHRRHITSTLQSGQLMLCTIWCFHGDDYEECRLLGYKSPVRTSQETHYFSPTESGRLMLCKIWGFHGGYYEECRLFRYKYPVRTLQETHYFSTRVQPVNAM